MDRYGVEGVQLISTQPIGLQVNRGQRHEGQGHHQHKDQKEKKDKKKKGLRLKDQVTLMVKHSLNERLMLDAPKESLETNKKNKINNREGPKKRIDIKV